MEFPKEYSFRLFGLEVAILVDSIKRQQKEIESFNKIMDELCNEHKEEAPAEVTDEEVLMAMGTDVTDEFLPLEEAPAKKKQPKKSGKKTGKKGGKKAK